MLLWSKVLVCVAQLPRPSRVASWGQKIIGRPIVAVCTLRWLDITDARPPYARCKLLFTPISGCPLLGEMHAQNMFILCLAMRFKMHAPLLWSWNMSRSLLLHTRLSFVIRENKYGMKRFINYCHKNQFLFCAMSAPEFNVRIYFGLQVNSSLLQLPL